MDYIGRTRISIASNGTVTNGTITPQSILSSLQPSPDGQAYVIDTATSLSASAAILLSTDPLITPMPGMVFKFRYMGQIETFTNSATVSILGLTLTSAQAGQQLDITCEYALAAETNTAQFIYTVLPLEPDATYVPGVNNLAITLAGATKTLVVGTDITTQYIATSGSLTGSWSLTGTPLNGAGKFTVAYNGTITIGAYALTIFGYTLTAAQAKQQLTIIAIYDSGTSSWITTITEGLPSQAVNYIGVQTYTITGAAQASATLTPGLTHQTYTLKTAGVVTLSGNFALTLATPSQECSFAIVIQAQINVSTYTLTIGGVVITAQMAQQGGYTVFAWWDSTNSVWVTQLVPPPAPSNQIYTVKVLIPNANVLTLYSAPYTLIPAPGAGLIIDPVDVIAGINYATAAFATHTTLNIGIAGADIALFTDTYLLPATKTLQPRKLTPVLASDSTSQQTVANAALQASVSSGNPTAGGGTIPVWISFMFVAL